MRRGSGVRDMMLGGCFRLSAERASPARTPADIPAAAGVLCIGGSTSNNGRGGWKWRTLERWCQVHPAVHVFRVNSPEKLKICRDLGVESIDGTGWPIGGPGSPQWRGMLRHLNRRDRDSAQQLLELA